MSWKTQRPRNVGMLLGFALLLAAWSEPASAQPVGDAQAPQSAPEEQGPSVSSGLNLITLAGSFDYQRSGASESAQMNWALAYGRVLAGGFAVGGGITTHTDWRTPRPKPGVHSVSDRGGSFRWGSRAFTPTSPRGSVRSRGRSAGSDPSSKITLTVTDVQRFLGKCKRAFYLLRCAATEAFAAPFLSQGRDHWLMRDLLEWNERRRRCDRVPGRTALSSADRVEVLDASEP